MCLEAIVSRSKGFPCPHCQWLLSGPHGFAHMHTYSITQLFIPDGCAVTFTNIGPTAFVSCTCSVRKLKHRPCKLLQEQNNTGKIEDLLLKTPLFIKAVRQRPCLGEGCVRNTQGFSVISKQCWACDQPMSCLWPLDWSALLPSCEENQASLADSASEWMSGSTQGKCVGMCVCLLLKFYQPSNPWVILFHFTLTGAWVEYGYPQVGSMCRKSTGCACREYS